MIKTVGEKDKSSYNELATHPLQSWEWGEFRKISGNSVYRFADFNKNNEIKRSYTVLGHNIPRTKYKIGTLIKGPVPKKEDLKFLANFAKKESIIFIKIEPATPVDSKSIRYKNINKEKTVSLLKGFGACEGKTLFTPTTFWVDLTKEEEELLTSFNSKTRYNIRLAQRKGVEVSEDNSDKAFDKYLALTKESVKRQGFYAHTQKYHELMWQTLHKDMVKENKEPIARLMTATYRGEIITTWVLFVWHNFLYYPYGASSNKYKNVMANNLIMWESIKFGKKMGLNIFDLWGREEGKGFTKFKEGYSPEVVEFLGTWDLPTSYLYKPYTLAEGVRWKLLKARTKFGLVKPKF